MSIKLTQLGPYKIGKPLGKGGMGSVFAATDLNTGLRVAIKALSPHLAMAEGFRERFEAEIESLKTLRHDGIVRLYGYGEQDGVLFYSMELVDGTSLEDELRAGRRFNWREVTSIAIQLSRALKHAHDHGIVHRDIKPANILLFNEDQVKLADFGIARLFGTTQLTTAGGVLGTADYMSPEQAEGRPVTARCDQYSLGGVMYALLAGRPPFIASNLPQMLQFQRFAKPEPVRRYARETPEQLEHVISQLLAKDPADRFPNMQVLARHLQALVRALSRPAADDFALSGDPQAVPAPLADEKDSLALEATMADPADESPKIAPLSGSHPASGTSLQEAATVAADATPARSSAARSSSSADSAEANEPPQEGVDRPARFTTLEEEQALLTADRAPQWLVLVVQLVLFAAVLVVIGGLGYFATRPPSPDDLYESIKDRVADDDERSLVTVASDIDKFLKRYPDDARAHELERYRDQIELDRLERQLLRQARSTGALDPSLLPIERLYLDAIKSAANAPSEAVTKLQAIVDLYGSAEPSDNESQIAAIVQLSRRRIDSLQAQIQEQHKSQLAALEERLNAAEQLAKTDAAGAAAMYQAILELHAGDDWASEIVNEARRRLQEMEAPR